MNRESRKRGSGLTDAFSSLPAFLIHSARLSFTLLVVVFLNGCQSVSTVKHPSPAPAVATQKWNPLWWLGNADDPAPPEWYRPDARGRVVTWQLRNPLHNFTFYVIGVADKPFTRTGKFPEAVFAPDGGWNWAMTRHRWVRLPFVSYNGTGGRFYLGWRERGNFGGKGNFGKIPPPDRGPRTPEPAKR